MKSPTPFQLGMLFMGITGPIFQSLVFEPAYRTFKERNLSSEYVPISKCNLQYLDLDFDKKNEATGLRYEGRSYLFKIGKDGTPYLEPIKSLESEVKR